MNKILFLILGIAIGTALAFVYFKSRFRGYDGRCAPRKKSIDAINRERAKKKEAGKNKIMDLFNSREKVTNNDVEKMLGISDASATRYLEELEQEGKIKQVNEIGRGVYYISIK